MITASRASEIASEWYDGERSPLYAIYCANTKEAHKALPIEILQYAYDEANEDYQRQLKLSTENRKQSIWQHDKAHLLNTRSLLALLCYLEDCIDKKEKGL